MNNKPHHTLHTMRDQLNTLKNASIMALLLLSLSATAQDMVNAGNFYLHSGSKVCVMGDVTNMGMLNNNNGFLYIGSVNFNNASNGTLVSSDGTIQFSGPTAQNINASGGAFAHLEINNSNGVIMQDALQVTGVLTLTNGPLHTNGNILELTSEAGSSLVDYGPNSFIIATSAAGAVRRHIDNSGNGMDTYAFPVGLGTGSGNYRPMELVNSGLSNGGFNYLDVFVRENADLSEELTATQEGTALVSVSAEEWVMEPDNEPTDGTYGLRLYIDNLSMGNNHALQDNKFTIVKRSTFTSGADYSSFDNTTTIPPHGMPGRILENGSGYAEKLGFDGFSGSSVAGGNDNLPIELLHFNAVLNNTGTVDLYWATASEVNNALFTVERGINGVDFATLLEREGAGNSNQLNEYKDVDPKPLLGTSYYRLRQTDYDGTSSYSKMVPITLHGSTTFRIWPNPATDRLEIELNQGEGTSYLKVYNAEGRLVYQREMDGSSNRTAIDLSDYQSGLYFITHLWNGVLTKTRFVKNRPIR